MVFKEQRFSVTQGLLTVRKKCQTLLAVDVNLVPIDEFTLMPINRGLERARTFGISVSVTMQPLLRANCKLFR